MTLTEILTEAKKLYPKIDTAWTDDQIVASLNTIQHNIFNDLQIESTYDFKTIDDTARYALPSDMEIGAIKRVMFSKDDCLTLQDGTVTVTAGAKTITGSGTTFTPAMVGDTIFIDNEYNTIASYSSGTSVTATSNFTSSHSGEAWYIYDAPEEDTFERYEYSDYDKILAREVNQAWYKYYDGSSYYLGLYPVPSSDGHCVRVIYLPKPDALANTEAGLAATPDLYYRWHNLLVYAVIAECAGSGSNPDITIANNFAMKYNTLLTEAQQNKNERERPGYVVTRNIYGRNNYARWILTGKRHELPDSMFED